MRITIDNLDGRGAVDYSAAVCADRRVRVERALNKPSRCTVKLADGVAGLALPQRMARVVVTADGEGGAVLFTGYVATEPVRLAVGAGTSGTAYTAIVTAVSDEWLLDRESRGAGSAAPTMLSSSGGVLLQRLVDNSGSAAGLSVSATPDATRVVGAFAAKTAAMWSENAGHAAGAAYASYRAMAGEVLLQPAGSTTHALSDADGTLDVKAMSVSHVRELANDVTLSGETEPAAYLLECFAGDGTTTDFELSVPAFAEAKHVVVEDAFSGPAFNAAVWAVKDPGSHLSLTSAGLTMNGGNGADGQTTFSALDVVEMSGAMTVELGSVVLGAASDGMLAGMYQGSPVLANCFAGFRVRQSVSTTGGQTIVVPVLNGAEVGTVFTPQAGHVYTLRLRLHCVEMQRVSQRYYAMVDGVVQTFGSGSGIDAPMGVVFELLDQGASSNTPATVLYDSAANAPLTGSPAKCSFVVANATQLFGSVGFVRVTRPGSVWVESVLPSGVRQTRLMGVAGEGVDCMVLYGSADPLGTRGKVRFFAGRVPVPGERVEVRYRGRQRSVARLADAASVAAEARGGAAGTCRWLGKVLQPPARNSADCESAAQAVLAFATSRSAALSGTYKTLNPGQDVWPGDVLSMTSGGVTTAVLARGVTVEDGGAAPEVLHYDVAFANDWAAEWADGVGVKLSEAIAADAVLPQVAGNAPGTTLPSLQSLMVTSLTGSAVQVDAGIAPPTGGGFEVRRRDAGYGSGGVDLVLRSPVRSFSIPRAAQSERFYVRMYDASATPVYSRFSSAVLVNAPLS